MAGWKYSKCLVFYLAGLFGLQAGLAEAREDLVLGSRYTSARGAALGDAFLPLGEDGASALFYNPAVVGRIRQANIEGLNLGFYGNTGYLGMFSLQNPNFYKVTSLSSYLSAMQANPGTDSGVGAAFLPSFSTRGFAAGMLLQSQLHAHVNADGTVGYRSLYQMVPTVATGAQLASGIVRIGYSLQWVNQASGTRDLVSAADPSLGYNQALAQGSALSHNLGFALTLPMRYLPQVDIVARNVLGVHYSSSTLFSMTPTATGMPADEPMTVDASFSVQPKIGRGGYFNFVFEDRDMTGVSGMSFLGRMAIGTEFSFRDIFYIRAGWGSGYPSLGVGMRRAGSEFAFSWSSEELGNGYQQNRDLKYMLQYQVRAF